MEQEKINTFHLCSRNCRAGLVLEGDPGGEDAALQAGGGRAAGAPPEVVGEELRSLDLGGTPDGGGVHPEQSVEGGVTRDGPAERGQLHLGPGELGQAAQG